MPDVRKTVQGVARRRRSHRRFAGAIGRERVARLDSIMPECPPAIVAVAQGIRPAAILVAYPHSKRSAGRLDKIRSAQRRLCAQLGVAYGDFVPEGTEKRYMIAARDDETLGKATTIVLAQRAARKGKEAALVSRKVGELLGYPECCIAAWGRRVVPGRLWGRVWPVLALRRRLDRRRREALALLDFRRYIWHEPCSAKCAASQKIADSVRRMLVECY